MLGVSNRQPPRGSRFESRSRDFFFFWIMCITSESVNDYRIFSGGDNKASLSFINFSDLLLRALIKDLYFIAVMDWTFRIKDITGRDIRLSKERWKHILRYHPEVLPYFFEIADVLRHPLKRREEISTGKTYYYQYFKTRQFSEKFLVIVVKYLNNHGFVISAYFIKRLK